MTRCTEPGCLRKPAFPDQSKCEQHRVRWQNTPTWRKRVEEPAAMGATSDIGRDWSGRAKSAA